MTTPTISPHVLQALLSPQNHARQAAEHYLQTMSVEDRCLGLLHCGDSTTLPAALQQLRCVLLRRDISKLTNVGFLQSMVMPLLMVQTKEAASSTSHDADNGILANSLKECIAQAIGVMSLLQAKSEATSCMEQVLQANGSDAMQGNASALKLLVSLAEQAPVAFCQLALPSLPQLIASALQQQSQQQKHYSDQVVSLLTELVVQTAMATTVPADQPWQSARFRLRSTTKQHEQEDAATLTVISQLGATCLLPLLQSGSFIQSETSLEHLLLASESVPFLLTQPPVWNAMTQTCLQIMSTPVTTDHDHSLEDAMVRRLQALQVVVNVSQVGNLQRTLLDDASRHSLCKTATELLVGVLSGDYMSDNKSEEMDEDEEDQLIAFASDLLEQLVHAMVDPAMPYAMTQIDAKLSVAMQSNNRSGWRACRGGLIALQCCLEAAPARSAQHFGASMEAALYFSSNNRQTDERVQYHALRLLGALCESRRSNQTQEFESSATRILQTLAQAAQSPSTKVTSMACTAIVAYCRPANAGQEMDADTLILPYLSDVLSALIAGPLSTELVNAGSVNSKVYAMAAVACLAEAAGEAFVPFYTHIMPGLWNYANMPASGGNSYELSRIKGAAIETATIIGQAIGEENIQLFGPDAEAIMNLAVSILNMSSEGEVVAGMPLDQLLSGCARIASVIGDKFAPFMAAVFPHLLLRATDTSGDVEISDCVEMNAETSNLQVDDEIGTESMTVTLPGRGLTNITINTSKIQEKAQAARAIYELASALGAAFGPYAKTSLESFLVLVGFKYSAEIRSTASQTLVAVFEAACACGEDSGMGLPAEYFPAIVKSLAKGIVAEDDADMEAKFTFAESISQVFYSVFSRRNEENSCLLRQFTIEDATFVTKLCMKALTSCLERRDKISAMFSGSGPALTEDDLEELMEVLAKEDELLTPLMDAIGYMLKLYREAFLPTFQSEVVPILGPYLRSSNDLSAKLAAVCLFDDCVEFCGATAAATYSPALLNGALTGLEDSTNGGNMDLKRASIYGIAQIARYAPSSVLQPHAKQIIPSLLAIVSQSKDEFEECPGVFENAVSALGSLALFGNAPPLRGYVKPDVAINILLANMPLREDCDEAKVCSSGFCDLVEQGLISLDTECDNILRIIGDTLAFVNDDEDLADAETIVRFVGILFRLEQVVTGDKMNQSFGQLSVDAQEAINSSMNQYRPMFANVVTPEK